MRFSLAATTLLAGLATAAPSSSKNDVNLDKLARRNGMLWFGTAADIPGTSETTDKSYLSILRKKFGEMTPANALKVSQSDSTPLLVSALTDDVIHIVHVYRARAKCLQLHSRGLLHGLGRSLWSRRALP